MNFHRLMLSSGNPCPDNNLILQKFISEDMNCTLDVNFREHHFHSGCTRFFNLLSSLESQVKPHINFTSLSFLFSLFCLKCGLKKLKLIKTSVCHGFCHYKTHIKHFLFQSQNSKTKPFYYYYSPHLSFLKLRASSVFSSLNLVLIP